MDRTPINTGGYFYINLVVIEEVEEEYSAYNPNPMNGEEEVSSSIQFSWDGPTAVVDPEYVVWFGTDPNTENMTSSQVATESYDPGTLNSSTIYYWRVDVVDPNINPDTGTGDPYTIEGEYYWSFTTIGEYPILTSQPECQLVAEGDTAVFSISLVDDTGASYQWYHSDGTVVSGATSSTLEITSAAVSDEDDYYCIATNPGGSTSSDFATLAIKRVINHWPMDGDLIDVVGGKDGVLTSGLEPNFVAGLDGGVLHLMGESNNWVDVGSVGISGNVERTISVWVQSPLADQQDWGGIFGFVDENWGIDTAFMFFVNPSPDRYAVFNGDWMIGVSSSMMVNERVNLVMTHDGTTTTWYLNDSVAGQATGELDTVDVVTIGKTHGVSQMFEGYYDDVKIYNYALSDMKIAMDYIDVMGGYVCVGESSDYDFNEDCKVDLGDLYYIAVDWLSCNRIPVSACLE